MIISPLLVFAWFMPSSANAKTEYGIKATIYDNSTDQNNQYNDAPTIPPTTPVCAQTVYQNLDISFDANPICDIYDDFVIRFDGYITAPETKTYTFYMHGDDGTRLYFDGELVEEYWYDTGDGGQIFNYEMTAGQSVSLLAWFYENGGGAWLRLEYLVDDYWVSVPPSWFTQQESIPTTTTIASYLNEPQNVNAVSVTESSVYLEWDTPEPSNVPVERYAIFFSCDGWQSGYAISSTETNASVGNLESDTACEFKIRADNDTLGVYSSFSSTVNVVTNATTSTTTTSTTSTIEPSTTTIVETTLPEETIPPVIVEPESPATYTTTTSAVPYEEEKTVEAPTSTVDTEVDEPATSFPQYAPKTSTETTVPQTVEPETPDETTSAVVSAVTQALDSATTPEEFGNAVNNALDEPLTNQQFADVISEVFASELTDAEFSSVLDAIFDEPLTDKQLDSVLDSLSSDSVSESQAQEAIDAIAEDGLSQNEATSIAADADLLEKISDDQAVEIFDAIDTAELSDVAALEIVAAVQDAPNEVREAFEEEIDVFDGKFDTYVPTGSEVSVKVRRAIVAASSILVAAPSLAGGSAPSSSPSGSGGSGGPSEGPSDSDKKQSTRRRRSGP